MISSSRSGFTIIELLIAVSIIIIMGAIGSSYFYGAYSNQQTEISSQQIISLLKAAQEKSASQENNSRWGVYISNPSGEQGYYALYQVDEELLVGEGDEIPGIVLQRSALPDGVIFNLPATGNHLNVLFARGTGLPAEAATISVSLANEEHTKTVNVNTNGQIE